MRFPREPCPCPVLSFLDLSKDVQGALAVPSADPLAVKDSMGMVPASLTCLILVNMVAAGAFVSPLG